MVAIYVLWLLLFTAENVAQELAHSEGENKLAGMEPDYSCNPYQKLTTSCFLDRQKELEKFTDINESMRAIETGLHVISVRTEKIAANNTILETMNRNIKSLNQTIVACSEAIIDDQQKLNSSFHEQLRKLNESLNQKVEASSEAIREDQQNLNSSFHEQIRDLNESLNQKAESLHERTRELNESLSHIQESVESLKEPIKTVKKNQRSSKLAFRQLKQTIQRQLGDQYNILDEMQRKTKTTVNIVAACLGFILIGMVVGGIIGCRRHIP